MNLRYISRILAGLVVLASLLLPGRIAAQAAFADVQVANFTPISGLSVQLKTAFITLPPIAFQGEPPIAYTAIKDQIPANVAITMTLFEGTELAELVPIDTLVATLKPNQNYLLLVTGGSNGVPVSARLMHNAQFETNNANEVSFMFFNASTGTEPFRIERLTDSPPYTVEGEMVSNFGLGDTTEYGGLTDVQVITFQLQEGEELPTRVQFDLEDVQGKALLFVIVGEKGGTGEQAVRMLGFTSDADPSADNRLTGQVPTSIDDGLAAVPEDFALLGNYPNPFNPTTTLRFKIPAAGQVDVRVFDLLGRPRQNLNLGLMAAGEHRFDLDATAWASGVYFYRVDWEGKSMLGKMTLIK